MSVKQDPRTGKWVVRWRDGGRHRSRSFTLKRDADHFDREQKRARRARVAVRAGARLRDRCGGCRALVGRVRRTDAGPADA